jgi:catechol 2,3-dioxygenase-like lactoylglutathione lyase family enzyme
MFTTNIALGVGVGNLEAAAEFYETELGLERGETNSEWIEMKAGPLNLYLVGDTHSTPTFEILVPEVGAAMDRFLSLGCEEVEAKGAEKERFIKTPFGQYICVSPKAS